MRRNCHPFKNASVAASKCFWGEGRALLNLSISHFLTCAVLFGNGNWNLKRRKTAARRKEEGEEKGSGGRRSYCGRYSGCNCIY